MANNFTVHIFGYGETQYIAEEINFKTQTSALATIQPLVDAIWAEKPVESEGGSEYHAINIFNYNKKSWLGNGKENATFKVDSEENLVPLIDSLIAEITALIPE